MSENHRSTNKISSRRNSAAVSSGAVKGPFNSTHCCEALVPAANEEKAMKHQKKRAELTQQQRRNAATHEHKMNSNQEHSRRAQSHRPHKSIRAIHPSIYLNTHSHRQLRRAKRIWKMSNVRCSDFIPSFKDQLKRVEMHRMNSEDAPKSISRSVRDLQLCSSGTDSSPSPINTPLNSHNTRQQRSVRSYHTRRYRKQLDWYQTLSRDKRLKRYNEKLHTLYVEGKQSPAATSSVKDISEYQDDLDLRRNKNERQRNSPSTQSPPEIRAPSRKTSRRSWRRQLDSSSSDSSVSSLNGTPIIAKPVNSTARLINLATSPYITSSENKECTGEKIIQKSRKSQKFHDTSELSDSLVSRLVIPSDNENSKNPHERRGDLKGCEETTDSRQHKISHTGRVQLERLSSKTKLNSFKHPESASVLNASSSRSSQAHVYLQDYAAPLRKPDTPRPKSSSPHLKWRKVLETAGGCAPAGGFTQSSAKHHLTEELNNSTDAENSFISI